VRTFLVRRCRRRSAFTLVELVVAIGLTAILLTGLSIVTANILGFWAEQAEDPLFDRHIDGLRRALEECVAQTVDYDSGAATAAAQTSASTASGSTTAASTVNPGALRTVSRVFTEAPSSTGLTRAPYLFITGAPPFLVGDTLPAGYARAWLAAENEELVLYWQTTTERTQTPDDTHRFVLSTYLSDMTFTAYNATNDEWQDVDPDDTSSVTSGSAVFMKLEFSHRGQIREFTLPLTEATPHNLNY